MKKVLVVNGSGRRGSNSRVLAGAVAEGAREAGHDVETVDIGHLAIKPCMGCEACHRPGSEGCVIKDDMGPLYSKFVEAEVVIFSSPIYWFNLCGQIKQFIDRLYAVALPGEGEESPLAKKKLGAVLVYGDTDPYNSGCVNALRSLQDICSYSGAEWAKALYASAYDAGEVEKNAELLSSARRYGLGL